ITLFYHPASILAIVMLILQQNQAYAPLTILLSLISGAAVGFSLGLIGGGGSILAVPLLLYVVGISDAHVAIGTSALAVGINALNNTIHHYKKGYVKIKEGLRFAIPGVAGTILGSQLGLLTPSNRLLILFGIFMVIISVRMLRQATTVTRTKTTKIKKHSSMVVIANDKVRSVGNKINKDDDDGDKNNLHSSVDNNYNHYSKSEDLSVNMLTRNSNLYNEGTNSNLLKLLTTGFLVGLAAGYFGIGGGFIIVPSLMHLGLNIIDAIGTSLIPVSMFGFSTAIRYSFNGQIEWVIALLFIVGGIGGGLLGTRFASRLPKNTLSVVFAFLLIIVAVYMMLKSVSVGV
ncbi:MAG TPA: sulfite exporter TauE/SafE family protein, partial [Nitrososphaeraceae archaeon]|nr:sulfite exporter TauE/SafE family protein [Nitrososphaeraceae archaeon]